jgi:hypothetical protein
MPVTHVSSVSRRVSTSLCHCFSLGPSCGASPLFTTTSYRKLHPMSAHRLCHIPGPCPAAHRPASGPAAALCTPHATWDADHDTWSSTRGLHLLRPSALSWSSGRVCIATSSSRLPCRRSSGRTPGRASAAAVWGTQHPVPQHLSLWAMRGAETCHLMPCE